MARKVAKTNHSVKLEPMTANERRIIHSALADDKYVETFSTGEEPYRYLIITPKKK
jgi:spoIIIJ-associated protein